MLRPTRASASRSAPVLHLSMRAVRSGPVAPQVRLARAPVLHALRRFTSSQPTPPPQPGFFRYVLQKLNPFNAYRDTKKLMHDAREFAVPEMRSALEAAFRIEKKVEKLIAEADVRDKEVEKEQEAFQVKLQQELARLQTLTTTMDPSAKVEFLKLQAAAITRLQELSDDLGKKQSKSLGDELRKIVKSAGGNMHEEMVKMSAELEKAERALKAKKDREQARAQARAQGKVQAPQSPPRSTQAAAAEASPEPKSIPLFMGGVKSNETVSVSQQATGVVKPPYVTQRPTKAQQAQQQNQ